MRSMAARRLVTSSSLALPTSSTRSVTHGLGAAEGLAAEEEGALVVSSEGCCLGPLEGREEGFSDVACSSVGGIGEGEVVCGVAICVSGALGVRPSFASVPSARLGAVGHTGKGKSVRVPV